MVPPSKRENPRKKQKAKNCELQLSNNNPKKEK